MLSEDVLKREMIGRSKIHSTRILTKTNSMPKWGDRFMPGQKQMIIVEESIVDRRKKTMTTYTRNIGLQKILVSKHIFIQGLCQNFVEGYVA